MFLSAVLCQGCSHPVIQFEPGSVTCLPRVTVALWNYSPLTYKTRAIKPSQWNCKDQRHLFSYKCSGILTLGEVSGGNGGVRTRIGDACPAVLLPCLLTPLPPTPVSTRGTGPTCAVLQHAGWWPTLPSPILLCSLVPPRPRMVMPFSV